VLYKSIIVVVVVDHLTGGARRRLVTVERKDRLPGRLRTGVRLPKGNTTEF